MKMKENESFMKLAVDNDDELSGMPFMKGKCDVAFGGEFMSGPNKTFLFFHYFWSSFAGWMTGWSYGKLCKQIRKEGVDGKEGESFSLPFSSA